MKSVVLCGIMVLVCCGCRDSGSPRVLRKRRGEVGGIVKAHYQSMSKYDFEVRGPLTLAEFGKELRESWQEVFELREKIYGPAEESLDAAVARKVARFKGLSKEGDELYSFVSEPQSWAELAGIAGYVLVRKDKIVDMMITRIN